MKATPRLMIAAALALATLTTLHAEDQTPPPVGDRISFGMVGITHGQTLRLNVVNMGDAICPCGRIVLTFLDANGNRLRTRDGLLVRRVMELQPGQAAFLDLNADDLQYPPGPSRLHLRALVTVQPPPVPDTNALPPGPVVPSVEIIDNATGRTVVFIGDPGVIRGVSPQPEPPVAR